MSRVTAVHKPSDYPGTPDDETRAGLAELFGHMFPGVENPEIDRAHSGVAIAALNPGLALHLPRLSGFAALQLGWSQRADLRELAIQTVNLRFKSDYSAQSRYRAWVAVGLSMEQLARGWLHRVKAPLCSARSGHTKTAAGRRSAAAAW
jgi:hypothetical protein